MMTSQQQTLPNSGGVKSPSSQEVSPVSLFPQQESVPEQTITVISGHKCYEQYKRLCPLMSLVKTLLVSSQWFSTAMRLNWEVRQLYSTKITKYSTKENNNSSLKQSVQTLNERDIPSNRLLFRLVPSVRLTSETACGSLQSENQELLPTPMTQGLKVQDTNGSMRPIKLDVLPTPTATDCAHPSGIVDENGRRWTKNGKTSHSMGLGDLIQRGLLLTPSASDGKRSAFKMDSLLIHDKPNAEHSNLAEQIAHSIGGGTSQLNPLFVEEMMGFPLGWTTYPFLSTNGETKV